MCIVNPFYWDEYWQDIMAKVEEMGFESYEDYIDAKKDYLAEQQMGLMEDERLGNL